MFNAIKEFFTGKKPESAPEAPYKVDAPVVQAVVEAPVVVELPVTAPVDPQITDAVTLAVVPTQAKKPRAKKTVVTKPAKPAASKRLRKTK